MTVIASAAKQSRKLSYKIQRFFLIITLFAGLSAAGVKYVAVVESDVDESSGASEKISRADVRLVTAELRREAVKNLPPKKYSIMTTETVIAQGSAVLSECHEENCVISLGSTIGADYIVRGTVSKVESKFTLQVEMYETEDGTLVASCDPVRSESIGELIEKAAEACANMFKTWVAAQKVTVDPDSKRASKFSVGAGALFASDFGGGLKYDRGQIGMPFYGGGASLTFDATYAAISIAYIQGGGKWKGPSSVSPDTLPATPRSSLNIGVYAKYPNIEIGRNINIYPILSIDYDIAVSGKLEYADGSKYVFDDRNDYAANTLSALWVKAGGGADCYVTASAYIRGELLYGARMSSAYEKGVVEKYKAENTRLGHGLTAKVGAGFRL
jgi:hypothetical protein